ncbi:MAG TPA: GAP family protein [Thermomicrobiales bacterium]|nr:GAP family protein [Thermomicrobiales bacterium]
MAPVIGDVLGAAIGVALSPMAVVGFILVLVSAGGLAKAWAFVGGWAVGVTFVVVVLGSVVSGAADSSPDETRPIVASVQIVLGSVLVFLAWRRWRGRPGAGDEPKLPGWMQALDKVTAVRAAGLGLILSAVNPKNFALLISAAGVIGQASLNGAETAVVDVIFIVLACLGMILPLGVFIAAGDRGPSILDGARRWLVANNATIMAVLSLILGVNVIGKGIGGF